MKNYLLKLSFTVSALILYNLAIAAPVEPVATMEVPAANALFIIDGVADDAYGPVQSTTVFNPTGYDGDDDFTCTFQVAYNPAFLYVLVNVTDDIEHCYQYDFETETGVGNPWEFDNIEFFLQLDTNTVITAYSATTVQLRVNRGLDSVQTTGHIDRASWGYYMEADAGSGWITEVAIPWTTVLPEGSEWEDFEEYIETVIGFDLTGADSDNTDGDQDVGNRDVQTAWDSDDLIFDLDIEDPTWNNTSIFGYITLASGYWPGFEVLSTEEQVQTKLKAYPNPAANEITFNTEGEVLIEIFTITGSLVMLTNQATVDITSLKSGMYVARIGGQSVKFAVE